MATRGRDVEKFLAGLNPRGELNPEEGFLYGWPDAEIESVLVTWMATVAAVQHAAENGCDLIVCHEALTFYDYFKSFKATGEEPWAADRPRLALLRENGISVLRVHSTVDPTHIVPEFARTIGLPPAVRKGDFWSYHALPRITLARLASRAKEGLRMHSVRVTGDPNATVTRVGTMVGGLGLDRHIDQWEKHIFPLFVEAIVVGETNDFAQRFALDAKLALIETCHSASEDPGLEKLSEEMREAFPGLKILFRPEMIPWILL